MPFVTPNLNDLVRVAENGLFTSFGISEGAVLRKSVMKVIARVFAGVCFLLVLLLRKMWKNSFIYSCDVETLKDNGVDFDLPNKPESFAKGVVVVKSTSAFPVLLPQGTVLSTDSGLEYEIDSDYTISGGVDAFFPINVIAVQSGSESNLSPGDVLMFRDGTPEGIDGSVVVGDDGISGGVKIEVVVNGNVEYWGEFVETYRERLLNYRRNQPHGGCDSDYKTWAERFACVSKCIVEPNYPETNSVTCVLAYFGNDAEHITVNPTNLSEVEAYIKSDVRRPITADVRVVSCVEKSVNFSVAVKPNNSGSQRSVQDALKKALQEYVPGDTVSASDLNSKLLGMSEVDEVVVVSIDSGTSVTLSKQNHELPVIGNIAWNNI